MTHYGNIGGLLDESGYSFIYQNCIPWIQDANFFSFYNVLAEHSKAMPGKSEENKHGDFNPFPHILTK